MTLHKKSFYINLLEKYMENVIEEEGISYVPHNSGYRHRGAPIFTNEEILYLKKIQQKIENRNN